MEKILCLFNVGFSEPDSFIGAHANIESVNCYLRIQALQNGHEGYTQHIDDGEVYYHTNENPTDMVYILKNIPIEDWVKTCPNY